MENFFFVSLAFLYFPWWAGYKALLLGGVLPYVPGMCFRSKRLKCLDDAPHTADGFGPRRRSLTKSVTTRGRTADKASG